MSGTSFLFYGKTGRMTDDPHQFTRDSGVWDARMGDEGNEFFKTHEQPSLAACALSDVWETRTQQEELPNAREMGCSLIIYFRFA